MSKNIKECNISAYECLWTGKNKKEIERFFKLCKYTDYGFVNDQVELLYARGQYVEPRSIIIANKNFGVISIFKD